MSHETPHVALVQDGARLHYALAVALQRAGILEVMYTDFFLRRRSPWRLLLPLMARFGSVSLRRMMDRQCPELDERRIRTNMRMRLRQERRRHGLSDYYSYFRWQAQDIARWVAPRLAPPANVLLGYVRHLHPSLCAAARTRGMRCIADQVIAPASIEQRELRLQLERFPGWEKADPSELDPLVPLEQETWRSLDAVTCASDYVASGLKECGVAAERIHVIPYPVADPSFSFVDRSDRTGPLTVGFVGQVGLRKGAPYFLDVAKRFSPDQARFVMLGHAFLSDSATESLRRHVEVRSVPRTDVPAVMASFDLIYFPTTCEGSAGALMEAMATGLPIVTSPNSGTVARHAQEAFICPYDDMEAATGYIQRLLSDRDLRLTMGKASAARYAQFNLDFYSENLARLARKLIAT